nr:hypothetical protein [Tanacetum cinerariifolium]
MLALLDIWRVRPELLMRLGYSLWMPVIRNVLRKWHQKRTTKSSPATTTTTTTPVTNAHLRALINQSVVDALAARDADRSRNGKDSHDSGTGVRRQPPLAHEMFPKESDKIGRYVGVLPDMIHESVMESKPKTMQDAVDFATELMDKKIRTFAEWQTKNKRKSKGTTRNNQNQQQQNNRQNTGRAYIAGSDVLDGEEVFVVEHEVAIKGVNNEVNFIEEVVEVINTTKLIIDVAQVSVVGDKVSAASAATTVSAATTTTATITTVDDITLDQALEEIKSTKPKEKGIDI